MLITAYKRKFVGRYKRLAEKSKQPEGKEVNMNNTKVKSKENAYSDWFEMIFNSWTWKKLTDDERRTFVDRMDSWCNCRGLLIGTYRQRWEILNELYYVYLLGLGHIL